MKKRPFTLVLLAPLALTCASIQTAKAQANDMFPSRAAAEKRAKELRCTGTFAMGGDWMPCQNLDAYEKATKKEP